MRPGRRLSFGGQGALWRDTRAAAVILSHLPGPPD